MSPFAVQNMWWRRLIGDVAWEECFSVFPSHEYFCSIVWWQSTHLKSIIHAILVGLLSVYEKLQWIVPEKLLQRQQLTPPQLQVSSLLNTNDCLKHYCLHSADFNVCKSAFNHAASLWCTVRVTVSVLVNLHGRCSWCSSTETDTDEVVSWIQWEVLKALEERRILRKTSVESDKAALMNSNLPSFSHSQSPWSLSRKRRTLRSTKLCWLTTCSPSRPGQRTVSTSHSTRLPYLPPFMRG